MVAFLVILATVVNFQIDVNAEVCGFNPLCSCRKAHHDVVCRSVPFCTFPQLQRGDIYTVTVIRSGIFTLESNLFEGTNVAHLHLMHNNIVHISSKAFNGLENLLSTLDLSYNNLNAVPFEALRPLRNLQWLNLHGNSVEDIHSFKWSELNSKSVLSNLFLGGNHISVIKESVLSQMINLTLLDFEGNYIYDVDANSLPFALTSLSFANNILKKVPLHAIYKLQNLQLLYLSGNLLKNLPCPFVLRTSKLEKLDLSNNLLEHMEECVLNGSFAIRELNLDFNFLKTLSARSFKKTKLERLTLTNNRLSNLHSDAFSGIEVTLTYLDLSFNLLKDFPSAVNDLKSLLYLSLKENYLKDLSKGALQGCRKTLEVLDLSGNTLSSIPKATLELQRKLIRLSLQDNFIVKIYENDFGEWSKTLTTLSLANNKINKVPKNIFVNMGKLRELNLSFNNIIYFDEVTLYPFRKTLEVLELSFAFSSQYQIKSVIFEGLQHLEWLLLDNNNLNEVNPSFLHSSKRLSHLDMSNNNLCEIPKDLFQSSTHISSIHIANNKLNVIKYATFNNLQRLSRIVLTDNAISLIESQSFLNCSHLHTIVLSSNNIYSINASAFYNLTRLSNLYIQDNYLESFSFDIIEGSLLHLNINISNNFIQSLIPQNSSFTEILKVRTLDVTHNKIASVTETSLNSISKYLTHLFLSYNEISHLSLGVLPVLQILQLSHNYILLIEFPFYKCCPELQILSLDHNRISIIKQETFSGMKSLRILDLSSNRIMSLPGHIFSGIPLEKLNLSRNHLKTLESSGIYSARNYLRSVDISNNKIVTLSSDMFLLPNRIQALNLSSNRITSLSKKCFHGLSSLLELDLSHNELKSNFENFSFISVPHLRVLNLQNCSLMVLPSMPLPQLNALSLKDNFFYNVSQEDMKELSQIKWWDLSGNFLQEVPSHLWKLTSKLIDLDVSNNPITALYVDSFKGLEKLQRLDIRKLSLVRLDPRALHLLRFLTVFKTDSYASVRSFRIQDILSQTFGIQSVTVNIEEPTLSHQVQSAFGSKLRELVITGKNLRRILPDAFSGLLTHELTIKISKTRVSILPDGLLKYLSDVRFLTLDLRRNQLSTMKPEVLAEVTTQSLITHQTQHITGGVLLEDNPWNCSCELLWMSKWMRRWLRETFRVHVLNVEASLYVNNVAKKATCFLSSNNISYSILHLKETDVHCFKNKAEVYLYSLNITAYLLLGLFALHNFLILPIL